MNTITLNGVSSETIQGLLIQSLPPISKPPIRVNVEEIDGRNGDIITDLGYQAYDKTITIGLKGSFDINEVISFFNSEGTVVFSNEPDKYYRYKIYQQIDFERLIRYRVANVTMHVQPFKYPLNETPISVSSLTWEGTDYDQTPYIFRATKDSSVEAGNREVIEQITGGTVAWNQLLRDDNIAEAIKRGVTWSRTNGKFKLSGTASSTGWITLDDSFSITPITDHVYIKLLSKDLVGGTQLSNNTSWLPRRKWSNIGKCTSDGAQGVLQIQIVEGTVFDDEFYVAFIDLTQMFGTTIADYIYNLETANAGAGVSLFKSLFPKDYYPYNAGELMSVKTSARETVGFNQWDEEWELGGMTITGQPNLSKTEIRCKNYIPAFPNTQYCFTTPLWGVIYQYDSDKNFLLRTPLIGGGDRSPLFTTLANTAFLRFYLQSAYGTTYNHDICINLSKTTGSPKNGDYEPYEHHTYPLSNIELRGIPKLVNNRIQYDGDIYKSDGSVTRRYGACSIDSDTISKGGTTSGGLTTFEFIGKPTCVTSGSAVSNKNLPVVSGNSAWTSTAPVISLQSNGRVRISAEETTVEALKQKYSGLVIVYELASPTTETTTPYTETQICSPYGTEEFIDDRDVQIPVGHMTKYKQIDPINIEITNSGNVPSMPTYRIEGSGSIDVNIDGLHAVTVDMSNINAITINSDEMNAYNDTGGFANRAVTGSYENLALPVGQNTLEIDGDGVIDLLVTNYERWL